MKPGKAHCLACLGENGYSFLKMKTKGMCKSSIHLWMLVSWVTTLEANMLVTSKTSIWCVVRLVCWITSMHMLGDQVNQHQSSTKPAHTGLTWHGMHAGLYCFFSRDYSSPGITI